MSEEDVRGGLRDAVADEPPLDFDPDELVATARHQIIRRRSLIAAGVATVAVAVAAVALPVVLGRSGTTQVGQPPATTIVTTTTSPTPTTSQLEWPPPGVEPVHYTTDQLRTRGEQMATYLRQMMKTVLPDGSTFEVGEFGGEATGEFYEGQSQVNAEVVYTLGGVRYSIMVSVWAPTDSAESFETMCADGCEQVGEQDGGPVMARVDDVGNDSTISTVFHLRKNGGVVQIAAYNYELGGAAGNMPAIPMTVEQQVRLATDPELGL